MVVNKLIATFEHERHRELQRQGILAEQKEGKYLIRKTVIRKTVITNKLIGEVQDLKETKNLFIIQIAKVTGKGRNTIYKILKQ
jgi:DNA invertase Pin-like site-specific DNA recombinase